MALSDDIVRDQWHKLLWNAGFNAICAVTGATAGEALAAPARYSSATRSAASPAREGARLGVPTPVNAVLDALLGLREGRAGGR